MTDAAAKKKTEEENLGFRAWEEQQKALDEFHKAEEKKKAEEEKRKMEELKAKESAVFDATRQSVAMMNKKIKEKEEEAKRKQEEENQKKINDIFNKHHVLRKSLREQEEKAQKDKEMKEKKKAAQRAKQLEKQALRMKKFEENQRWKTLPSWQKEREEEHLELVKRIQKIDPSVTKYEFFDASRAEAWDVPKLEKALSEAETKKAEEMMAELSALMASPCDKANFFVEDANPQWKFDDLAAAISAEKEKIDEEMAEGEALLEVVLTYDDSLRNTLTEACCNTSGRPRWDMDKLNDALSDQKAKYAAEEAEGEKLFEALCVLAPAADQEPFRRKVGGHDRWNFEALDAATKKEKARWNEENAQGEKAFAFLQRVEPEVSKETYFRGEASASPWDTVAMETKRANRTAVEVKVGTEGTNPPGDSESRVIVMSEEDGVDELREMLSLKIDKPAELITLVYKGTQYKADQSNQPSLKSIAYDHSNHFIAVVSSGKKKGKKKAAKKSAAKPNHAKTNSADQGTVAEASTGVETEEEVEKMSKPTPCCSVQ